MFKILVVCILMAFVQIFKLHGLKISQIIRILIRVLLEYE